MEELLQENAFWRQKIAELQEDQISSQCRLAEYVYHNKLEQEFLQSKIKFVKEQIAQFSNELAVFKKRADSFGTENGGDNSIQLDEEGEIKAASKEKLIELLWSDNSTKGTSDYTNLFILTYRYFATTREVIEELIQTYTASVDANSLETHKIRRLKIINFLRKWCSDDFDDLQSDKESFERCIYLVENFITKHEPRIGNIIRQQLEAKEKGLNRRQSQAMFSEVSPPPLLPKVAPVDLLELHPLEIARQLTIMDYNLCKVIRPKEFLGLAWTKKDKEQRSPNLLRMIYRFNHVSRWVIATLVSEPILKKRAKLLSHILSVAQHLQELNNFNAIFQMNAGLGHSSVFRLHKTFALLKPEKKKILDEMKVLTDPMRSWSNYRRTIHEVNPPCVPFIGVYQTDLTFIEDGCPDKFSTTGLFNFKKCRLVASVIDEIQQYQLKPYNLQPVQMVQDLLLRQFAVAQEHDEKHWHNLSLTAEPRASSN